MTTTPDARPVSEERLAELIGDVGAVADLVDGHWREVHSALRELQSLRASLRDAQDAFVTQSARLVQAEARIASLEKDAAGFLPVARFLLGEDALKGFWFGERPAGKPQFWWREHLRAAIAAAVKEGG